MCGSIINNQIYMLPYAYMLHATVLYEYIEYCTSNGRQIQEAMPEAHTRGGTEAMAPCLLVGPAK